MLQLTGYIIRRLLQAVVVVLGVTMIAFGLEHLLPGGIARAILGPRATQVAINVFNKQNGFDSPIWYQYWVFLDHLVVHGNLGFSYKLNRSVDSIIASDLPRDVMLVGYLAGTGRADSRPGRGAPGGQAQPGSGLRRHGDVVHPVLDALLRARADPDIALLHMRSRSSRRRRPRQSTVWGMLGHPVGIVLR